MAGRLQCIAAIDHQSCVASAELVFQDLREPKNAKEKQMKYKVIVALMLIAPVVLLAAPKNSANVTFTETVTINGTAVPPGDYHVVWQGTGPSVVATILQGKKVVASAPATLVNSKSEQTAVETSDSNNNSRVLEAIDWGNLSLHFGQASASSPGTSTLGVAN
jgi:hypothetical protein